MKKVVDALKREKLFIFLFLLSIVIFLWDLLFLNKTFFYGDYKLQHFPWAKAYSEAIKSFRLPLWDQYMGCGFPLFAEGQVGALYPLNLVMFFFLPFMAAYTYSIVLHFMLGGIFMYIFMRKLGLNGLPASLPAILFMFSSPYAGCFSNIASLKALCWLPLVLYIILASIEDNKPLVMLYAGAIMGFQLLAGAVQMAVYSVAVSVFYFIFLLISRAREKNINVWKYLLLFGFSCGIALLIWSPQLIATSRLVSESGRGTASLDFALLNSFFPLGIATLIFPYLATIFRGMIYIGILPLIFAIISLYKIKNKQVLFFASLFILSLLCAFGSHNPFYVLLLKFAKLYFFRVPLKLLFFSAFSLIMLSGFGLNYLLEEMEEKRLKKIVKVLIVVFIIGLLLFLAANILLHVFGKELVAFGKAYAEKSIYNTPLHRKSLEEYTAKVEAIYDIALNSVSFGNPFIYIPICIIILSLLFLFYKNKLVIKDLSKMLIIIIVFCDLLFFSLVGIGFKGNILKISGLAKQGDLIEFIKKDDSIFRIYIFGEEGFKEWTGLKANLNMYFKIDNVGAYTPLVPNRYRELLYDLGCVDDSLGVVEPDKEALKDNLEILSMLNVKYIISQEELNNKDLELRGTSGQAKIYLNKNVLPRAYLVSDVKVLKDEKEILSFLKSGEFDPRKVAVLEEELPAMKIQEQGQSKASLIYVKKYTDNKIIIETNTDVDSILVLSDCYYPGWRAFIDNKEVKIYRANFVTKAVYLPKGMHEVEFLYHASQQ